MSNPSIYATTINNKGKKEKNVKVKEGNCIFPYKYKFQNHTECIATNKGDICATEVNPKTRTLIKYGYCQSKSKSPRKRNYEKGTINRLEKGTTKKALKIKLKRKIKKILSPQNTNTTLSRKSKSSSKGSKPKTLKKPKSKSKSKSKSNDQQSDLKITPVKQPDADAALKTKPKTKMNEPKVYNTEFIEVLDELAKYMQKQGEPFKARAYQKAQETIITYSGDITTHTQLEGLPAIGKTILTKLAEYEATGKIAALEKQRNNPINILTNIYGVGPKKAQDLISKGFDTIEKIQALPQQQINEMFNAGQRKGLEYYDDINQKIPRADIIAFEKVFKDAMKQCCAASASASSASASASATRFEIVGSYRRGKQSSGDIDLIITNDTDDKTVFNKFLDALTSSGVLEYSFSKGATKSLTMCRLTPSTPIARRVDFLYSSPQEYPFAILYFTGSKFFNTVMRQHALRQGYTLNEHGLSHMSAGVKGAKVEHEFHTEKDIFDFLGLVYKTPEERIDGRAVQTITATQPQLQPEQKQKVKLVKRKIVKIKTELDAPKNHNNTHNHNHNHNHTLKRTKRSHIEHAKQFKNDGISYLEGLTEDELINLIHAANDAYYNKKPFLSDEEFDIVKEFAEQRYPANPALKAIGAPIDEQQGKMKVKLPYNMPSMNKIKPDTDALAKWKAKYTGPYVISTKLDGVSGLFVMNGTNLKLYTRGDGTYGQDITHLIPYLRLPTKPTNATATSTTTQRLAIRGEFIIPKKVFADKYAGEFSNPRNFIAGLINSKTIVPSKHSDIHFVAYEVIEPLLTPSQQFEFLKTQNVEVAYNRLITPAKALTNDLLSDELVKLRGGDEDDVSAYEYEIDGIIVADDKNYQRTPENPEHAFAFKMVLSDQVAEVKVLDVLWSPSKDGYLKPRVQVEPVILGGAKIEYATGFNAKFIQDNKIGVGAVIKLVRSGDVIPHIMSVVKPAEQAMMPMVAWKWNPTNVDAVLEDKSQDETVLMKTITLFFKHMETAGMGPGNVAKLITNGYNSIPKILHATPGELQPILGKKNGQTVFDNIKKSIAEASMQKIMTATNIFGRGFGEKRFASILKAIPDVLTTVYTNDQLIARVANIKGMSATTATEFVNNLPEFIRFLDEAKLTTKTQIQQQQPSPSPSQHQTQLHPLFEKKIVMTGFRDKGLTKEIEEKGGELTGSVSKNTFVVLVKDKDEDTGKAEKAKTLNIPIMTPEEFKQTYL